jgi:hypothetical protein
VVMRRVVGLVVVIVVAVAAATTATATSRRRSPEPGPLSGSNESHWHCWADRMCDYDAPLLPVASGPVSEPISTCLFDSNNVTCLGK